MADEKITSKWTTAGYRADVNEMADVAAGLPESRREGCISDNVVGYVWPNQKDAILVALNAMTVNPGEFMTADDIAYVLNGDTAKHYDGEPLWAVLDLAVRCGMIEETLRLAAEVAKDLPPFVTHGCEGRVCHYEDCYDGQTRYPEEE